MEETQCEVDSLDCDISIASLSFAGDTHVVECEVLKLLDSPWCEHHPRENRVDDEDRSIGYPGSHARTRSDMGACNEVAGVQRTCSGISHKRCIPPSRLLLHSTTHQMLPTIQDTLGGSIKLLDENALTVPTLGKARSGKDNRTPIM